MRDDIALRLTNVNYSISQRPILKDLSLKLGAGETAAIIGPSGCGKSSLLKLCLGIAKPHNGSVEVLGESPCNTDLCQLRRRIGYAVQGNGLFPHLSAAENISIMARLERWPTDAIEQRLQELCALLSMERTQIDRHPHELSGGQQQRVGIARAMMLRPQLLLLDEPFAAIDPLTRSDIHLQLERLREVEPVTLLLVTHDMSEAIRLAERIVVMTDGEIHSHHASAELLELSSQTRADTLLAALLEAGK